MIDSQPAVTQLADDEFRRELEKIVGRHMSTKRLLSMIELVTHLEDQNLLMGLSEKLNSDAYTMPEGASGVKISELVKEVHSFE